MTATVLTTAGYGGSESLLIIPCEDTVGQHIGGGGKYFISVQNEISHIKEKATRSDNTKTQYVSISFIPNVISFITFISF